MYKDIWDASSSIGEDFICKREPGNQNDTHAMAITKEDVIFGHVPRTISPICSIFIRRRNNKVFDIRMETILI